MNQLAISAKTASKALLDNRDVTSVDVREIRMQPGQQEGQHLHPCAVLGRIVEGATSCHIEDEAVQAPASRCGLL
jgi:hypothetical protein